MEELRKINTKIKVRQIERIVVGIGTMTIGVILLGKFIYQKGITDCQISISAEFPEEYTRMTEKLAEAFESFVD